MAYACEHHGYQIVTRESFFKDVMLRGFEGAPSMTPQQITLAHERETKALRERATKYPGAYVLFDPWADGDGWMLVGDDPAALDRDTMQMEADFQ